MMLIVNGPPRDEKCACCGRSGETLELFGPGPFVGQVLAKNYRHTGGQISASWECRDCFMLSDREYWRRLTSRREDSRQRQAQLSAIR